MDKPTINFNKLMNGVSVPQNGHQGNGAQPARTQMDCIIVDESQRKVILKELSVHDPDFFNVVSLQSPNKREQIILDIIRIGSTAVQRIQTTTDLALVQQRFDNLALEFQNALKSFEKQTLGDIEKFFSPVESKSYTKYMADLISQAKRDFENMQARVNKYAADLLDPEKNTSAIGQLKAVVTQLSDYLLNTNRKNSFPSQFQEQLQTFFGGSDRIGVYQKSLNENLKPIVSLLQELKEKLEVKKATEDLLTLSPSKGKTFEELVQDQLGNCAHPFGDVVDYIGPGFEGSKKGDFLVALNGNGKRFVVETRDRKEGVTKILRDLQKEMEARDADLAIYVSSHPDNLPREVRDFQIYHDNKIVTHVELLPMAYRVGRLLVLRNHEDVNIDLPKLTSLLEQIKNRLKSFRNIKGRATNIINAAEAIHSETHNLQEGIEALVAQAQMVCLGDNEDDELVIDGDPLAEE